MRSIGRDDGWTGTPRVHARDPSAPKSAFQSRRGAAAPSASHEGEDDEEQVLRCVRCNGKIAYQRDVVTVAGAQVHTKVNSGGFCFRFGCFARADGCRVFGEPSLEDSWFPGTPWQYVCCASCLDHLGWRWTGEGRFFFGIILDRVR